MGIYVYSLRKKHVEATLGISTIDVVSYEYAYKESFIREGEYGYAAIQRLAGRVSSLAQKAKDHYFNRAKEKYGTTQRDFYFVQGGLADGNHVYKIHQWLPITGYDEIRDDGPAENIGRLYKIGRGKWTVSDVCPKHDYEKYTTMDDTPVYQCQRCDATTEKKQ
jgi:hypothetical protein